MATVPLARALSKRGVCSRSQAIALVLAGQVRVDGAVCRDPGFAVVPERADLQVDSGVSAPRAWTCLAYHKPRGLVTTRRDPQARETVFDALGTAADGLQAVGRLDLATAGLLLLTNDSRLADWLTDPAHAVPRTYLVSVRGFVLDDVPRAMTGGVRVPVASVDGRRVGALQAHASSAADSAGEWLAAASVEIHKRSKRETHLMVTLTEGRNREVRRLFEAFGHEVTRLLRVAYGPLQLGDLAPGRWREVTREEMVRAFPSARFATTLRR